MQAENEYEGVLAHLYGRNFILHDTTLFDRVLYFYLIDALAHIDYTCGVYAFNYMSPKNVMTGEYLRWRIDEEKRGDRPKFAGFVNWLRQDHPERFARLPSLWQMIYDTEDPAEYRSFRIVLDPDTKESISPEFFIAMIDEFFDPEFLKGLYEDGSLAGLFRKYITSA
ncbi:MAG TPA: hypothetical protein VEI81_07740 [Methanoregula sp.]|nr:hypothetical protein [Methanoregula sp.]